MTYQTLRRTGGTPSRSPDDDVRHTLIIGLRLVAIVVGATVLSLTWAAMSLLPWEADAVIAVLAALAWAYKFEREG
jgi:hypothetical protein